MQSEKRKKFVRLAENRTTSAIKAIRNIGKLGNKSSYEYDDKDVKKIVGVLTKELDAMKARLSDSGSKEAIEFRLD